MDTTGGNNGITGRRPGLGMGLFVLFALGLLLGWRFGGAVIWRLGLNPAVEPMPVLMYHNVAPDGTECNSMTVTVSKLRTDFQFILDHGYTPILPRELLDPDALPDRPILLTFDDGYVSNYTLLYPLLREYRIKAVISPIVSMPDTPWTEDEFCSWEMYREMASSGLVEIGSHTYALHNLDTNGNYVPDGPNGVQRRAGERDEAFQSRVLDDIRTSHDRIAEELGTDPVFFAYPFGAEEPAAQSLIDELFPVSVVTRMGTAELIRGMRRMPRWTITMEWDMVYSLN